MVSPSSWSPDPAQGRQLLNFELAENSLDALYRSTLDFDFRPGARRYLVFATDDTFLEPPAVFSDGTPASYSFVQVSARLADTEVRLFAVNEPARGRGVSAPYDGQPSLVEVTGGLAEGVYTFRYSATDFGVNQWGSATHYGEVAITVDRTGPTWPVL